MQSKKKSYVLRYQVYLSIDGHHDSDKMGDYIQWINRKWDEFRSEKKIKKGFHGVHFQIEFDHWLIEKFMKGGK